MDLGKLVENWTGQVNENLALSLEKVLRDYKDVGVNDWKIVKSRVLG